MFGQNFLSKIPDYGTLNTISNYQNVLTDLLILIEYFNPFRSSQWTPLQQPDKSSDVE